ncbi:MAG: segregation/condensation protein A [Clostridia bacterium]|nr:segregation/condensation protein A [Clostridia bacterium]MBQ9993655.1 segregation/condensation protein A [Clostridia bacterium]
MEKISYKLEVFEGPLDLLLHLISKNKLNIYDIPISELLQQYLEHIERMREADIDVASEFLTMASRLIYIKTAMLMPRHEEAEELKRELVGELIEYQLCRDMAQKLAKQANFDQFSREEMEIEADQTYRLTHDVSVLYKAYIAAAGRGIEKEPPKKEVFGDIVAKPIVSVNAMVVGVLRKLYVRPKMNLSELFSQSRSKSEAVATFLAVLELLKAKRIMLDDDANILFQGKGERSWKYKDTNE